jgi:hypothetical protein
MEVNGLGGVMGLQFGGVLPEKQGLEGRGEKQSGKQKSGFF